MGHIRLGTLPKTRKWQQVVSLITEGADVERIAAASADAAEHGLERASSDQALAHAFWLLTQLPQAARQSDFADHAYAARTGGIGQADSSWRSSAAFTNAVDLRVREAGKRTDLGEMAQHAAAETLTSLVGRELPSLFGPTAGDVQQALAKLGTSDRFSIVARDFFSRLATSRSLGYFLSRELSKHVGPNKRFAAVGDHSDFNAALDLHCREASRDHQGVFRRMVRQDAFARGRYQSGESQPICARSVQEAPRRIAQAERRRCLSVSSCVVPSKAIRCSSPLRLALSGQSAEHHAQARRHQQEDWSRMFRPC